MGRIYELQAFIYALNVMFRLLGPERYVRLCYSVYIHTACVSCVRQIYTKHKLTTSNRTVFLLSFHPFFLLLGVPCVLFLFLYVALWYDFEQWRI